MSGKYLGKIVRVNFGAIDDYPFLFGISYEFNYNGWTICGHDVVNTNLNGCELELGKMLKRLLDNIKDAKVQRFQDLVGIPIELTINNGQFQSFRILKEVL